MDSKLRKVTETECMKPKQVEFSNTQETIASAGGGKREHHRTMIQRFKNANLRRQHPDSCTVRKRRVLILLVILTLLEMLAIIFKTNSQVHQSTVQTSKNADKSVDVNETLKEDVFLENITER